MNKKLFLVIIAFFAPLIFLFNRKTNTAKVRTLPEPPQISISGEKEETGMITLRMHTTNKEVKISLEEYIKGVVAAEMPVYYEIEALKAQAVAARTYTKKKLENNEIITTDYRVCQAYKSDVDLRKQWGENYTSYSKKIRDAVNETKGEMLTYEGETIQSVFHAMSGGSTRSPKEIWEFELPYLVSVDSSVDKNSETYIKEYVFMDKELGKLLSEYDKNNKLIINERSPSGYVTAISCGAKTYTGEDFRMVLGLRSSNFELKRAEQGYHITTRGYGHGVGMSQNGANELAKKGKDYQYILNYYYPGTKLLKDMYIATHLWQ